MEKIRMLKYSITALALVAGSTFALADPNPGGANSPGSSPGAMEHSGSMSGGATKGNGVGADTAGAQLKGERSSAGESGARPSRENTRSNEGFAKSDRQANDNEGKAKPNKQAQDGDRNLKGDNRQAKDNDRNQKNSERNDRLGADQSRDKSNAERSSTGASEGVEGKGGARGSITNVTTEQKTRVKSVFLSHRVAPARDLDVSVNVGVRVPRSVHFYPIPEDIVTIAPDYRGYEYFMIDEAHVAIVDPDTLEVVDIIIVA
jgi:Protein of unknown function (DUF1236)